jgi:CRP/FNR family transcriptional regulator, dissimilatory nitrate respiration regulator
MALQEWLPERLARRAPIRALAAGEPLFHQDDPAHAVFDVEAGRIQLVRYAADGRQLVLYTAIAGDSLAEAALFAPRYHCFAVAAAPSRVRAYDKEALIAALRADPALAEAFMAVLARQVHALRARLEQRGIRSAQQRLLQHLALAAGAERDTVRIEGTYKELAAELGLTHEALYRALAGLERQGLIQRRGRIITLTQARQE